MKYNPERELVEISIQEFVSIARRGISPSVSYDEDEPNLSSLSRIGMRNLLGDTERGRLSHIFISGENRFELSASPEKLGKDSLTIARAVESDPDRLKKNELAQIRGEGYIAAYMLAREYSLASVELTLLCYNESSARHVEITERVDKKRLDRFFDKCMTAVSLFAKPQIERVTLRLPSMKSLKFPYQKVRQGQGEFVRAAYRTLSRGGYLYATAPTGTGKTVSALYPALRVLGDGRADKIFYLTPKATTAEAASDCLMNMAEGGAIIRAVILTAKEKICTEGRICRRSSKACRMSSFNRIAEATLALYSLSKTVVGAEEIREISRQFSVCPYELSLTYAELCDVVICDVNYLFDPAVYIKRFFTQGGKYAFLIDEAHNLNERAREMYSAQLSVSELTAPSIDGMLGELSATKKLCSSAGALLSDLLHPYIKDEIRQGEDGKFIGATAISELPSRLYSLFDELMRVVDGEIMAETRGNDEESEARLFYLRDFYYRIKKFAHILTLFDETYKAFIFYNDGELSIKLYCLDTGPIIRRGLSKGCGAVLFSATLSPLSYYRAVLGGDRSDDMLEVNSPFDPSQLSVSIVDSVSTRFSERADTLTAVCKCIAATVSARRGNYMVFSPSFAYSEALSKLFSAKYPKIKVLSQTRDMSVKEKADFLSHFKTESDSYLIGFCVMGGIYSEGIDLAGDALIGAIIVGIGMPALSYERETIAEYYEEKYEEGKQYAYIYPGMNRVFQAAGRVIRREDDRGVIVLIDDRFNDPLYRKSLPKLWEGVRFISSPKELREELDDFWASES